MTHGTTYIDGNLVNHLQKIGHKHNGQDMRVDLANELLVISCKTAQGIVLRLIQLHRERVFLLHVAIGEIEVFVAELCITLAFAI